MVLLLILLILSYRNKKVVRAIGYVGIFYGLVYLVWRFGFSMPADFSVGMIFGIILVLTEFVGMLQSMVFKTFLGTTKKVKPKKDRKFTVLPSVDVVISTYNEPLYLISRTIISASKINYPKCKLNVYVGDDGNRKEVKDFCEKVGVHYVTREDHTGAKAGNINNVLNNSSGEYILLLDADMIPKSSIIMDMIYYFEDSKTGFVQAPQVFYNQDVYQRNLNIGDSVPNEQDFFMRDLLEKRAVYNAVLHVGSNAIFKRAAIDDIGGIPTKSITEDMATGMLIQAKGYKSFFVNKALAIGLSVETIEDLIKQRDRWLRGNIQVSKKYHPLKIKGLNLKQRIIYFDGLLYWTYGLQKMVYTISPLLFLLFGVTLFNANGIDIVLFFLPYFAANILYFRLVSKRKRNITWSHIYDMALAPHMAWSFLTELILNKPLKFKVTPKDKKTKKRKFNWRLGIPHVIILIATIVSLVLGILKIVEYWGDVNYVLAIGINIAWCCYNGLATLVAFYIFSNRKNVRSSIRIPANITVKNIYSKQEGDKSICEDCGYIMDLSDFGAKLFLSKITSKTILKVGDSFNLEIQDVGKVDCTVLRKDELENSFEYGVFFTNIDFETMNKVNQFRFDERFPYMNEPKVNKKKDSMFEILRSVFRKK